MKTHTELLNQLIAAVYALPLGANSKVIHDLQMLAAEIKGRMMAQLPPMMTFDTETGKVTPTVDSDGWIENTGVMPECEVVEIKFRGAARGFEISPSAKYNYRWHSATDSQFTPGDITHYKPA